MKPGKGKGGLDPVQVGKAGERAAGIVSPKVRIPSLTGTAKYRIPDELTPTTLREVKNVRKLGLTRQIQDFLMYSRATGREFILEVRRETQISEPLQRLIDAGEITLRRSLP